MGEISKYEITSKRQVISIKKIQARHNLEGPVLSLFNMQIFQSQVKEFMRKAGQATPEYLTTPDIALRKLRLSLLWEELKELAVDGYGMKVLNEHLVSFEEDQTKTYDPVKTIDAHADIEYVNVGAAIAVGMDLQPALEEVHRSNMTKFIDGHRREDGKWIKGPSYTPANFEKVIEDQTLRQNTGKKRPLFVCIDGPDNVGKTTTIAELHKVLTEKGFRVLIVREPGGTIIGEEIRKLLKANQLPVEVQLHLIKAQRACLYEYLSMVREQNLADIVLSDRGILSTWAYQQKAYDGDVGKFVGDNKIPFKWDFGFLLTHQFEQKTTLDHYDEMDQAEIKKFFRNQDVPKHYFNVWEEIAEGDMLTGRASGIIGYLITENAKKE